MPYYLALLADALARSGDFAAGLEAVEQAFSHSRQTNERWWDAELHRQRAVLLAASGPPAGEAEAALERALEVARAQQARSLELRSACSLAGLWTESGRAPEARELLSPLYASFAEGLDTPDLAAARELLKHLS
jgi:predicted ATPase